MTLPITPRYNTRGISPKQLLLEVMWDTSVGLALRMTAADKSRSWTSPGDFCEPDLTIYVPQPQFEVVDGGKK
jgi:hypothetical protein